MGSSPAFCGKLGQLGERRRAVGVEVEVEVEVEVVELSGVAVSELASGS